MNQDPNNPDKGASSHQIPEERKQGLPAMQLPPQAISPPLPPEVNEPYEPLEDSSQFSSVFEGLLKRPQNLAATLHQEDKQGRLMITLALMTTVALLIFGLTVGSFSMKAQLWASPLKIMIGTIMSALICFPSLYIFSCLTGTSAGLKTISTGLLAALALLGILLLGFAPVLWVFSQSTYAVGFMGFLVLASWLIALYFAIGFIHKLIKQTGTNKLGPIKVWATIFLLVTLQMSTSLRPIIGSSDKHLTHEKKFFLQHWSETVGDEVSEKP